MSSHAFVTLATTDAYALGALVLGESLRQTRTQAKLVVLISHHLSDVVRQTLQNTFDEVIPVEELNSNDEEHLRLLARPELGVTFTKINCWLLTQYEKCVFLDSDCLVLRPIDELFEREEFSAARDAGWPDCFNSGVFVYRPSKETFRRLMEFSSEQNVSFDGGDQGLLNEFFSDWRTTDISRHLPFTFNVTANAFYSYLPAVTRFRNDIHVVHFAGATKPWQLTYNPQNDQLSGNLSGQSDVQRDFLLSWWKIMHQHVWPNLSKFNQTSTSGNPSFTSSQTFADHFSGSLHYANLTSNSGVELGSAAHRRAWEAGHVDYFGRDSFSNIQQQLERSIAHLPQPPPPPPQQQRASKPKEISPDRPIMDQPKPVHNPTSVPLTKINPPAKAVQSTSTQSKTRVEETKTSVPLTPINAQPSHPVQVIPISVTKEIIPPVLSTPTPSKSLLEETKTSAHSLGTTQSSLTSADRSPPTHAHESNWTVKSTIVTAYSQGAGPTVVSKMVSETSASSSNDVPVITSIKQKTDGIILPEKDLHVKCRNDHFAWLFDKVFIAITYTISLCYLLFLVAIRRSKDSSLIDDNGVSLRHLTSSPKTANENRVKK